MYCQQRVVDARARHRHRHRHRQPTSRTVSLCTCFSRRLFSLTLVYSSVNVVTCLTSAKLPPCRRMFANLAVA